MVCISIKDERGAGPLISTTYELYHPKENLADQMRDSFIFAS